MPPERSRQLIGNVWRYVTAATSGGNGGSQTVQQTAGRVVTTAEIASLGTVFIELVPAPGVGFALIPLTFAWTYRFGTTPYDSEPSLNIDWDGTTYGIISANSALFRTVDSFSFGSATSEARKPLDTAEDLPLILGFDSGSQPVDGDGSGFAVVTYQTVPLS
jgi:hypothetical protein